MIRPLLVLCVGLALSSCNLEEAERMDLDRSGVSTMSPGPLNPVLIDLAGKPLGDTLKILTNGIAFQVVADWDPPRNELLHEYYRFDVWVVWRDGREEKATLLDVQFENGDIRSGRLRLKIGMMLDNLIPLYSGPGAIKLWTTHAVTNQPLTVVSKVSIPIVIQDERPR